MKVIFKKPQLKNDIFWIWIVITYIPVSLSHYITVLSNIGLVLQMILVVVFLYYMKGQPSLFSVIVFIFQISFLLSDFVNSCFNYTHIRYLLCNIIPCLALDYAYKNNKQKLFFRGIISIFRMYVLIHTVIRVAIPDGLYLGTSLGVVPQYFLENDNAAMPYIYILFALSTYNFRLYKENKITYIFDFALCAFITIYAWSATGVIVGCILCISCVISKISFFKNKFPFAVSIIVLIGFFFGVVASGNGSSGLLGVVGDWLGKDTLTFSGRTYIWLQSISVIKDHIMFGASFSDATQSISTVSGARFVGAHNQFLEYAVEGGLVSIILFVLVVVVGVMQINKNYISLKRTENDAMSFLYLAIVAILTGMMMEIYYSGWCIIILLAISYHQDRTKLITESATKTNIKTRRGKAKIIWRSQL